MFYKRSSFINLLRTKYDCEIITLRDRNVLLIKNGPAQKYMYLDALNRIDYEEIYGFYKQLCLPDLPSASELELADNLPVKPSKKKEK